MKGLVARGLDLLYPPRCVACAAFGEDLCEPCAQRMVPAHGEGCCARCGLLVEEAAPCRGCAGWRDLDGARAAFQMEGPARRVVHGLKFSGIRALAAVMAEPLRAVLAELAPDAVYATPIHPPRRRWRGYNQVDLLFEQLDPPFAAGRLERVRSTSSQVGLSARERRENVAGAFRFRGPELRGATVAVLDDVVTTGATAGECARVLRAHGAARVYVLAYARASYRSPQSGRSGA